MLHEYAVDPGCLADWQTFRFLTSHFGIPFGRLISGFPKAWPRLVHEGCRNFTFVQRQKMALILERLKREAIVRSGRPFDSSATWKRNAFSQHTVDPFHAVITDDASGAPSGVLAANEISEETALWHVPKDRAVPRTLEKLGRAVSPLLRISNHILFVDKLFEPATPRWREPLLHFIRVAMEGRHTSPIFEYHLQFDGQDPKARTDDWQAYCEQHLCLKLPQGVKLNLHRWEQLPGGEGLHPRYILTERGGIRFDWGLDTGRPGETTDVSLLDYRLWEKRWESYQEGAGVFHRVDMVTIEGR